MTRTAGFAGALRIAVAVGCLITLSSCSAVRIAYTQLDWLIERRVAEYVSLEAEQHELLEARIDSLLDWHCRTQLHGYADWLRQVDGDLQESPGMPPLRQHIVAMREAWGRLMVRAAPAVAELAGSLTDRQVAELLAAVDRNNEEYRARYVEPPGGERRRDRAKRMQKALSRWLGALTERQQQAVQVWSGRVSPMGEVGLANRVRWRSELAGVLERRHDAQALAAGLERLMVRWRDHQSNEYRRRLEQNTELFVALLEAISDTMTPRQAHRLSDKVLGYAADLDALSCRAAETAAPGTNPSGEGPA